MEESRGLPQLIKCNNMFITSILHKAQSKYISGK